MNRSQTILHYVASQKTTAAFDEIFDHVQSGLPVKEQKKLKRNAVNALVHQLVVNKKLHRTGKPRNYRYRVTAAAFVDVRRSSSPIARAKPLEKARAAREAAPAPLPPKPVAKPAPAPATPPGARRAAASSRVTGLSRPAGVTNPAPAPVIAAETVEQFLAKGGRIQYLKPGESSGGLERLDAELAAKVSRSTPTKPTRGTTRAA